MTAKEMHRLQMQHRSACPFSRLVGQYGYVCEWKPADGIPKAYYGGRRPRKCNGCLAGLQYAGIIRVTNRES